jgi:hypothetical protein
MAAPAPSADPRLASRPLTRESRIRFPSRHALQRGLDRARHEAWIEAFRADWSRLELVIRMAGAPRPQRALRLIPGGHREG